MIKMTRDILCENPPLTIRKNPRLPFGKRGSCLDIEIYLEALEAVHAAGFGDGVQVLFRVLGGHCEASKQLVIT